MVGGFEGLDYFGSRRCFLYGFAGLFCLASVWVVDYALLVCGLCIV